MATTAGGGGGGGGGKRNEGGVANCPNKWNPYHKCSDYCATRWASSQQVGISASVSVDMILCMWELLLQTQKETVMLPPNWKKVVDEKT